MLMLGIAFWEELYCGKLIYLSSQETLDKMATFGETSLRNVGSFIAKNFSLTTAVDAIGRAGARYRAKYITCKNARMTPFWHAVGLCMVLNYYIEYPHLSTLTVFFHSFVNQKLYFSYVRDVWRNLKDIFWSFVNLADL